MIGIDHNMAPVDIRAHFAFTKKNAGEAMEKIKNYKGIYGCVILSTCNRLEVWASVDDAEEVCLYDCLCQLKGITEDSYKEYFVERKDKEAVEHLFYLTSGLKSQIIGEDQIFYFIIYAFCHSATSKSLYTAYCFSQLKQGTSLLWLNPVYCLQNNVLIIPQNSHSVSFRLDSSQCILHRTVL